MNLTCDGLENPHLVLEYEDLEYGLKSDFKEVTCRDGNPECLLRTSVNYPEVINIFPEVICIGHVSVVRPYTRKPHRPKPPVKFIGPSLFYCNCVVLHYHHK